MPNDARFTTAAEVNTAPIAKTANWARSPQARAIRQTGIRIRPVGVGIQRAS
jgi:hypothetical protein